MGLHLENLAHPVLRRISLTIAPGELVVIAGPSGAGKTTLLRTICGLEKLQSGTISLFGKAVHSLPPHRRGIAMLFQNHQLFPHLTVFENMAFPLKKSGISRKEVSRLVEGVASRLGLEDLLERFPDTLSGGEKQRVSLATMLSLKPRALLWDEPMVHLDVQSQYSLREEIKRIQRDLDIPFLYVTHDQSEAMAMADRLGILLKGTLLQLDRPQSVYVSPCCLGVANFLGNPPINQIEGRLEEGQFISSELPPLFLGVEMRGPVTLVVRPENVHIVPEGYPGIPVVMERREFLGDRQILYLKKGNLKLRCEVHATFSWEGMKKMTFDLKTVHCFPSSS